MEFQQLSPQHLLQAIISGCENLKQARKKLNEINFFPVADGDTGDNMAATASAIIENASVQSTMHETLESVANASILGARGNSGMLFSSFFNGLYQAYSKTHTLTTQQFSDMLQKAANQVRESLINPMEGTLLTVVESWAKLIQAKAKEYTNFKTLCHDILHPLHEALHQNCQYTYQNQEQVLDAGALGFYHFVEGFSRGLGENQSYKPIQTKSIEDFLVPNQDHQFSTNPPHHRYCTEALLRDALISPLQLQQHLQTFGDSIVVTGHQHLQRFHIHTNAPQKIFESLLNLGRIANPKVDDMQRQFDCHICKPNRIALLTDSSADLPVNIMDKHQIHLLPINIHLGHHHLLDPYSIDPNQFYHNIKKNPDYPTTSAPNPLQIKNKFQELSQRHQDVIMIAVADKLSSTHATATNIAKEFSGIRVVNSKLTSAAQSLLVYQAAALIANPLLDADTIVEELQASTSKIVLFVLVHKLDALMRSGRVDKLSATFANWAQVKPILRLNDAGRGSIYSKSLTMNKGFQQLLKAIEEEALLRQSKLKHFAIIHAGQVQQADNLAQLASSRFQQDPLYIGPVSAAIGLHAGAGSVGIAAMFE